MEEFWITIAIGYLFLYGKLATWVLWWRANKNEASKKSCEIEFRQAFERVDKDIKNIVQCKGLECHAMITLRERESRYDLKFDHIIEKIDDQSAVLKSFSENQLDLVKEMNGLTNALKEIEKKLT